MPVVPLTSQLVVEYSGPGGATAANILHFLSIGGDFDSTAGDIIAQAWGVLHEAIGHEDWNFLSSTLWKDLSVDPADELVLANTPISGDATGGVLPAQCAACISLNAGGGRRRKGRIYYPGIAESYVDDGSLFVGTFGPAVLSEFTTFATTCAVDAGWVPAVYSRTDGVARAVASVGIDSVVDTQRRRVERLA